MPATPQTIRFTTAADGVRLAHASSGSGRSTLIKAATWLSHLELDIDSPVWSHLVRELSIGRRFVRYDERGCGLSDWDCEDLGFEAWVSDLETIADTVGGERFALLGVSQGAAVAIAYAVRHPERVRCLVLHGGYARGRLVRAPTPQHVEEAQTMSRLAELGWGKEDASYRQFFSSQFLPGGSAEQHRWFNELMRLSTSPRNAGRFIRAFDQIDVTALLPQVRCPALVLHSRHDVRVPFDEGRLLATAIPNASFVPIDSRNHLLLGSESAWPHWVAEVRAFLAAHDDEGGIEATALARLSTRQREILEQLALGHDNVRIAAQLGLAEKTVRNQVSAIFDRLGVSTRAQAIVLAREAGLGSERHPGAA